MSDYKNFIVKTHEDVEGTYEIQARDAEHAQELFEQAAREKKLPMGARQRDYMAFDVEVQSVDLGPPPDYPPCRINLHYFNILDEDGYRVEEGKLKDGDPCQCGERKWSWESYNSQERFQ